MLVLLKEHNENSPNLLITTFCEEHDNFISHLHVFTHRLQPNVTTTLMNIAYNRFRYNYFVNNKKKVFTYVFLSTSAETLVVSA